MRARKSGAYSALAAGASDRELELRPAADADRPLLMCWFSDPEISIPWCGVVPGRAELQRRFAKLEAPTEDGGSFIASADGEPIGYLAYDSGVMDESYLHIALVPEARGRGIGPRLLRMLAGLLFDTVAPAKLLASPSPESPRVIRALEKAGFRHSDPLRGLMELERADPMAN